MYFFFDSSPELELTILKRMKQTSGISALLGQARKTTEMLEHAGFQEVSLGPKLECSLIEGGSFTTRNGEQHGGGAG